MAHLVYGEGTEFQLITDLTSSTFGGWCVKALPAGTIMKTVRPGTSDGSYDCEVLSGATVGQKLTVSDDVEDVLYRVHRVPLGTEITQKIATVGGKGLKNGDIFRYLRWGRKISSQPMYLYIGGYFYDLSNNKLVGTKGKYKGRRGISVDVCGSLAKTSELWTPKDDS